MSYTLDLELLAIAKEQRKQCDVVSERIAHALRTAWGIVLPKDGYSYVHMNLLGLDMPDYYIDYDGNRVKRFPEVVFHLGNSYERVPERIHIVELLDFINGNVTIDELVEHAVRIASQPT